MMSGVFAQLDATRYRERPGMINTRYSHAGIVSVLMVNGAQRANGLLGAGGADRLWVIVVQLFYGWQARRIYGLLFPCTDSIRRLRVHSHALTGYCRSQTSNSRVCCGESRSW